MTDAVKRDRILPHKGAGVIRAFTVLAIPATLLACSSGHTIAADEFLPVIWTGIAPRSDRLLQDGSTWIGPRPSGPPTPLSVDSGSKLGDRR